VSGSSSAQPGSNGAPTAAAPQVLLPYMAAIPGRSSNGASVGWGVPQASGLTARTPLQTSESAGLQSLDSHGSSVAGQPLLASLQVCQQAWTWADLIHSPSGML